MDFQSSAIRVKEVPRPTDRVMGLLNRHGCPCPGSHYGSIVVPVILFIVVLSSESSPIFLRKLRSVNGENLR